MLAGADDDAGPSTGARDTILTTGGRQTMTDMETRPLQTFNPLSGRHDTIENPPPGLFNQSDILSVPAGGSFTVDNINHTSSNQQLVQKMLAERRANRSNGESLKSTTRKDNTDLDNVLTTNRH